MEKVLGSDVASKFSADIVRRVLEMAIDKGHPDPRHEAQWWDWKDWTLDGRQWQYDASIRKHSLEEECVKEHERRSKLGGGFEGSNLKIERKLEGAYWGDKLYPSGRTSLRSSTVFSKSLFDHEQLDDDDDDQDEDDEGDSTMLGLWLTAGTLDYRYHYDASITEPQKISCQADDKISPQLHAGFKKELPFSPIALEDASASLTQISLYMCTDNFAVKEEQESSSIPGVASISVSAMMTGIDNTGKQVTYGVVAEAPLPIAPFKEELDDRIAGFVFRDDAENDSVHVTYVESAFNDLQSLDDDQKDAFLVDRGLILHRLAANAVGWDQANTPQYIQHVPTSPRPDTEGIPPIRTLETMMTVHRADPRWPLVKPNSSCLECGIAAKSKDPNSHVENLLTCSKCQVRRFCCKECLATSWKSKIWPHSVECKRVQSQEQFMVGSSLREKFEELATSQGGINKVKGLQALEQGLGKESLDERADTVEELRDQGLENAKELRKAKKAANKKKKSKGKKR
jgi:hypothetical protein